MFLEAAADLENPSEDISRVKQISAAVSSLTDKEQHLISADITRDASEQMRSQSQRGMQHLRRSMMSILQTGVYRNFLYESTLQSVVAPISSTTFVAYHVYLHRPTRKVIRRSSTCLSDAIHMLDTDNGTSLTWSRFRSAVLAAGALVGSFDVARWPPAYEQKFMPTLVHDFPVTPARMLVLLTQKASSFADRLGHANRRHWVLRIREDALWLSAPSRAVLAHVSSARSTANVALVRCCGKEQHYGGVSDKAWMLEMPAAKRLHTAYATGLNRSALRGTGLNTCNSESWLAALMRFHGIAPRSELAVTDGRVQAGAYCFCETYFQPDCLERDTNRDVGIPAGGQSTGGLSVRIGCGLRQCSRFAPSVVSTLPFDERALHPLGTTDDPKAMRSAQLSDASMCALNAWHERACFDGPVLNALRDAVAFEWKRLRDRMYFCRLRQPPSSRYR